MSLHFKPDEPVTDAIQRLVLMQTDLAINALADCTGERQSKAVHTARKCIKKIRALLRVIGRELRQKALDKEHARLRRAAAALAEVRDAQIFIDAVDRLATGYPDRISGPVAAATRDVFTARRDAISLRCFDVEHAAEKAIGLLRKTRERVIDAANFHDRFVCGSRLTKQLKRRKGEAAAGHPQDWFAFERGLRRIQAREHKARLRASAEPTAERLHQWRKRIKDLGYALEMVERVQPALAETQLHEARELADALGEDHDLALLKDVLQSDAALPIPSADRAVFTSVIDDRRSALLKKVSGT